MVLFFSFFVFFFFLTPAFSFSYGDKVPRSVAGRLFGVVWINVGLVILAIFMGMITASLSSNSLEQISNLYGMPVSIKNQYTFIKTVKIGYYICNLLILVRLSVVISVSSILRSEQSFVEKNCLKTHEEYLDQLRKKTSMSAPPDLKASDRNVGPAKSLHEQMKLQAMDHSNQSRYQYSFCSSSENRLAASENFTNKFCASFLYGD